MTYRAIDNNVKKSDEVERFVDRCRALDPIELATLRTETAFRMASIEGQLLDPVNDTRPEVWRRQAKLALHYSRRELRLLNDIDRERREHRISQLDHSQQTSMVNFLRTMIGLHDAVRTLIADDNEGNWRAVENLSTDIEQLMFAVPT